MSVDHPSAEVLGRLLVTQQTLDTFPDVEGMAEFLRSMLRDVPGIADALICLHGRTLPTSSVNARIAPRCPNVDNHPGFTPRCSLNDRPGLRRLAIRTQNHAFGCLQLVVGDETQSQPYTPFLVNLGHMIATVLESRDNVRVLAERTRELEMANRSLRRAQRIARLGSWELDLTSNVLTWSDELFRILEIDPLEQQPTYEALINTVHPDDRDLVNNARTAPPNVRTASDLTFRLLMRDGRVKYVNARTENLCDRQGRPSHRVGTVQNVTWQKLAELNLEAERRRFEDLVSILPVGVIEISPEGANTYVNKSWLRFVGRTRREITGARWTECIHPDDIDCVRAGWAEAVPRRLPIIQECRLATPNGTITRILSQAVPRHAGNGTFLGYVAVALDTTRQWELEQELREHGRRFEALVDNLPGMVLRGVLWPDSRSQLLYISRNSRKMIGLSADDCLAMSCDQMMSKVHPDDHQRLAEGLSGLMATGKCRFRIRTTHADGHFIHQDFWLTVIEHRDGGVVYEGLVLDVTEEMTLKTEIERHLKERRRLEQQIHEARRLDSLGRLAGGIAHDFNNILGAIMGFARFVSEDTLPGQSSHRHAARILSAAERGKTLVDQILVFSRHATAERSRFSVAELVTDCQPLLQIAIPSTVRLNIEVRSPAAMVKANRTQLGQVVMNLCFNARDAMEGRNGDVTVAVEVLPSGHPLVGHAVSGPPETADETGVWTDGDGTVATMVGRALPGHPMVALSVTDSGPGIDPPTLSTIFDPFFTTKETGKGTGLGLSVVQGIMVEHDGAIVVRSRPGQGCAFHALLPLDETTTMIPAPEQKGPPTPSASRPQCRGRVLLVDDDHDFGDMLSVMLERQGWSVLCQSSPRAGLETFANEPETWSVLVTDQIMPDMRGQDLIAQVQAIRPDLPCILCTGWDATLDEAQARKFGAAALLRKPFEPEALIAAIMAAQPSE